MICCAIAGKQWNFGNIGFSQELREMWEPGREWETQERETGIVGGSPKHAYTPGNAPVPLDELL